MWVSDFGLARSKHVQHVKTSSWSVISHVRVRWHPGKERKPKCSSPLQAASAKSFVQPQKSPFQLSKTTWPLHCQWMPKCSTLGLCRPKQSEPVRRVTPPPRRNQSFVKNVSKVKTKCCKFANLRYSCPSAKEAATLMTQPLLVQAHLPAWCL